MDEVLVVLTLVTALGCGLSAGALFAFSSFVMGALARLPVAQGIAAMNSINVVAVTPMFMTARGDDGVAGSGGDGRAARVVTAPCLGLTG